jgi:hypothetical protein
MDLKQRLGNLKKRLFDFILKDDAEDIDAITYHTQLAEFVKEFKTLEQDVKLHERDPEIDELCVFFKYALAL